VILPKRGYVMKNHDRPLTYVAGHTGMVGSALCRRLKQAGYPLTLPQARVELTDQTAVFNLFERLKPEWVFVAAARVGGIYANSTYPAEFIYSNLAVQTNLIHAAYRNGVKKLLFLGSSCIYPRDASQPIKEEYILSGYLEPTNLPYAVAKIAGIIMAQAYNKQYGTNFLSVMPCNLYGPNDNFDLKDSHVVPALIRKIHESKEAGRDCVELWGTGNPLREFLHVDDCADACVFLMETYNSGELVNVGSGTEVSIRGLAELIQEIVGFQGELVFDSSMPDGTPRKLLDISRLTALGWDPKITLRDGLKSAYQWFLNNHGHV